jgi:uncharacterized protein
MAPAMLPAHGELGPGVTLELSSGGGHVGFVGGRPRHPEYWLEQRLAAFAGGFMPV